MKIIRSDYVFSYWIFVWYILYILKFINNSPKFALILGLIVNIFAVFTMMYKNKKVSYILFFIIVNSFIKVLPLWTTINDKLLKKDIFATFILFLIYNIWLYINKTNMITIYYLINEKNYRTAISFYLINIFNKYFDKYL